MGTPYAISSDLVSAYPAKSLAIAQYIDGYKLDTGPVQNAQTGTSYSFSLTDTTKTVTANNAAASAYTIPPQSSVVWEAYTVLRILNLGAGVVTLTAGAGVTLTGTVTVAQYASATLTRTGSNAWTISGNASASGMDLITPTSVAGSGVTLSGGQVSFSASTTISLNGCFSSAYDVYKIVTTHAASSNGQVIHARLRLAGTDNSGATSYIRESIRGVGASVTATNVVSSQWDTIGATDTGAASITMDVFGPALAKMTNVIGTFTGYGNTTSDYTVTYGGRHDQTIAYDGISFIVASGNITGTLRVYGLRNS
jgi:hypothetical protein